MNRREAKIRAYDIAWRALEGAIDCDDVVEGISDRESQQKVANEIDRLAQSLYNRGQRLKEPT